MDKDSSCVTLNQQNRREDDDVKDNDDCCVGETSPPAKKARTEVCLPSMHLRRDRRPKGKDQVEEPEAFLQDIYHAKGYKYQSSMCSTKKCANSQNRIVSLLWKEGSTATVADFKKVISRNGRPKMGSPATSNEKADGNRKCAHFQCALKALYEESECDGSNFPSLLKGKQDHNKDKCHELDSVQMEKVFQMFGLEFW
jgi:hypothetical protein